MVRAQNPYVRWFEDLSSADSSDVGGKNASLGEMIRALKEKNIRVPEGFATTAQAYRTFIESNRLQDEIRSLIDDFHAGKNLLDATGKAIRELIQNGEFPDAIADAILDAYRELGRRYNVQDVDVAVRSSATAEDLPEASFAGQLETYLNIVGEEALLEACRNCFASLFTDRGIAYREEHGFDHLEIALSAGVQKMVRSDLASAGVLFTLDTDSGFRDVVLINASWGLGESVVKGTINPDQYTVYKRFIDRDGIDPIIGKTPGSKEQKVIYSRRGKHATREVKVPDIERRTFVLSDEQIVRLAQWGLAIEEHYGVPMDVEWAMDGEQNEMFIVQARPETVHSRAAPSTMKTYRLAQPAEPVVSGIGIGQGIAAGDVCVIEDVAEIGRFRDGAVLVTTMTDPDWVPIMKRAAAIVTDHGGRTSHAAIVSRELGIPAVVGTDDATTTLKEDEEVTVSCADGSVYRGRLTYEEEDINLEDSAHTETQIMMNVADPQAALRWWRLPCSGVGLARMEYLINNVIKVHPLALTRFDEVEDDDARAQIEELTWPYDNMQSYFVEELARGIATIAAVQYPDPVIVRMSDFKTNEYARLIGGRQFEPEEANPMLGWRGASRYYSEQYRDGFALECQAIRRVRARMGFKNVKVMIPFCRTPAEADRVLEVMKENGLDRGQDGLEIYVMAEIPTNILEAKEFARRFDGFSVGSNDLTQLVLGISRDEQQLAALFDESEPSVKKLIRMLISDAHEANRTVGICGEAPADNPEFTEFLVQAGIDSISVGPYSILRTIEAVARAEGGRV